MANRVIFANNLPYHPDGGDDPLKALSDTLAFSAEDWGSSRAMAWVWGIVLGWDTEDDGKGEDAMSELAARFGWGESTVKRLRRLHEAFKALEKGNG